MEESPADAPAPFAPAPARSTLAKGVAAGKKAFSVLDFVLRLVFFLVAPQAIAFCSLIFPIWGIVINVCVALVVFFVAHRVRQIRYLDRVLGRALRFEAYYREHAPKPFLYYVFFPLLFPYWLVVGRARREVAVYRPFSGVPLVVLVATNTWQFFARYRPEIPFQYFAVVTLVKVAVELATLMLVLMPVASSVVTYEQQRKPWHLRALLLTAILSIGWAVHRHVIYPPEVASLETQMRAKWRTRYDGQRANDALLAAGRLALDEIIDEGGQIPSGYRKHWIEGEALDQLEEQLEEFYKPDEAAGFRLSVVETKRKSPALLLFQGRSGASLPHVWIALDADGEQLPDGALSDAELIEAQRGKASKTRSTRKRRRPPSR